MQTFLAQLNSTLLQCSESSRLKNVEFSIYRPKFLESDQRVPSKGWNLTKEDPAKSVYICRSEE